MKTRLLPILLPLSISLTVAGCGGQGGQRGSLFAPGFLSEEPNNSRVNAIAQAKPEIMVIPSDNLLQQYGALENVSINGANYIKRDYSKYLLANPYNKVAVSAFQDEFIHQGYPLTDLEQTLKSLGDKDALNAADNLATDAKTLLLQKAAPDIIIELDYTFSMDNLDKNLRKKLSYTVSAFDAYTNKAISSTSISGVAGEDFKDILSTSLHKSTKSLMDDIKTHFADVVTQGREVTVRFTIEKGAKVTLSSECATGGTYSDWIMDYMDLNTKKGTYKLQTNTDKELLFTNARIPVMREDGTQFSAYHWARLCTNALRDECGVKAANNVQGLGDIHITIKGF